MTTLNIVLSILDIIFAIAIIVLFLVQEGNDKGMGAISGATADSYYSRAKGQTLEERLKQMTKIVAVAFAVVSVVLYIAVTKGF